MIRKDKIRNEYIRETKRVAQATKKMTDRRLKWHGRVMTRDDEESTDVRYTRKRKRMTEHKMEFGRMRAYEMQKVCK